MRDHGKELMEYIKKQGAELLANIEDKLIFYKHDGMIYRFSFDEISNTYRNSCSKSIDGTIQLMHIGEDFMRRTAMKEIRLSSKGSETINKEPTDN